MKLEYIIFPSSYFSLHKVDEDLQKEYDAAVETGLFRIIFFGYEKWFQENWLVITEKPEQEVLAVYRGWMMQADQYADFYARLLENNIRLITSPEEYERFHIFPNIYPKLRKDTAKMMVYPDGKAIDLVELKENFERFMVKDYVKSVKGTEFPCYFTREIEEEAFQNWMKVFFKYRGNLYTGGICVKEFLDLKVYDGKTNEYRAFIINGKLATLCRNSLQPDYTAELPREFLEEYMGLDSPMYTIDCAELADGSWKIIEAGDGQVSGLSEGQNYVAFFRALYYCFA